MSGPPHDTRLTAVLDLHQARDDGHCSQCRMSWPCTTYITLTGRPPQTVSLARSITGQLPMADTLLKQVDQIATRHIEPEAFTNAAELLKAQHPDSPGLHLLLTLVKDRSATLREVETALR